MNRFNLPLALIALIFCLNSFSQKTDTAFALHSENARLEKSAALIPPTGSVNVEKRAVSKPAGFKANARYNGISAYIGEHLEFPEDARAIGITGKVKVAFDISTTGKIENIEVLESPIDILSDGLIVVLLAMPVWNPAYDQGVAVKSRQQLHVNFRMP